ncbi:MAG TPA: HAD family hydrolase [Candidatus Paceibacterota bacterium]|nr:HAD family hydrolase [Candidatus Paceibacterota bacterium]
MKKLVIFDFDGVLVNTIEFCFNGHKKSNPDLTFEKFQSFCDGNWHDGLCKAVEDGAHTIPENWSAIYGEKLKELTVSEILDETIKILSEKYLLTVVSSTDSFLIDNFLKKENVRECFSDILGADVERSKVIKINSLLKKYDLKLDDVVFITDSLGDILEANECGVKSVGVTWGIHPRKNLEKGKPVAIIDDPRDLEKVIKNVLK